MPLLVLFGLLAVQIAQVLWLNGGAFSYTLDDPYIHLALAEEIARGHYGINPGEAAAPSSSIVWPFLLAPWVSWESGALAPLVLNLILAGGAVWAAGNVFTLVVRPDGGDRRRRRIAIATFGVTFIAASHLTGLVLNGMEHVLQLFLAVLAVWGVLHERETGEATWWLAAALALAPLARYEGLALTATGVLLLAWRGHRRLALGVAVAALVPLAAFSGFLVSLGQEALPTSVLVKSHALGESEGLAAQLLDGSLLAGFARNLVENMRLGTGRVLAVAWFALLGVVVVKGPAREDRALAAWAATALGLHLAAGQLGWFARYEVYVWIVAVLVLLWLGRAPLRRLIDEQAPGRVALLAGLAVGLLCQNYVASALLAPKAANDIYEQHGQMHRFAADYWQGPVGVGDIGWVSFRNDAYVLDFNGLASLRTLELQAQYEGKEWVNVLTEEAGVRFLMTADFDGYPPEWIRIGRLHLSHPDPVTPASSTMAFMARDAATADTVRARLPDFIEGLPRGVRFEWVGAAPQ